VKPHSTFALVATAALAVACAGTRSYLRDGSTCPEGYVPVDAGEFAGRAISADGVVLAVRVAAHEPRAPLEFWTAVLAREMTENRGYAARSSKQLG
jgi:hypothetical protein